nr:hypothetical protein GCM10010200_029660 [Actinomadura rugatobispora]
MDTGAARGRRRAFGTRSLDDSVQPGERQARDRLRLRPDAEVHAAAPQVLDAAAHGLTLDGRIGEVGAQPGHQGVERRSGRRRPLLTLHFPLRSRVGAAPGAAPAAGNPDV